MNHPPRKPRTEEYWNEFEKHRWINRLLPPRLQKDLKVLPSYPPDFFSSIDIDEGEGLFLYGKVETGKTVLAAQYMLEIKKQWWLKWEDNRTLVFVTVPTIFEEIKKSFDTEDSSESDIVERYKTIDLLVLDDLGISSKVSDWFLTTLYLIINYRYEHLKPTIITSNQSLDQLAELFGDTRITSRIQRMCKVMKKTPYEKV